MTEGICLRPGISYRGMDEANMPARQRCSGGSCPDFADSNYDGEGLVSSRSGYDPDAFGKLVQIDEQAVPPGIWKRPNRTEPYPPEQDTFAWLPIASSPLLLLGPKGIAAYLLINGASACGVEFREETPRGSGGEICDGKDNDGDGLIDEELTSSCYTGSAETRGIGECHDGMQTCTGGTWGTCIEEQLPTPEDCDNMDNDCDRSTDEELSRHCYTGSPDTRRIGECLDGIQTCTAGEWSNCIGEQLTTPEICDNLDNDCDGGIDEELAMSCYTGPAETRGVGECLDGMQTCAAGEWSNCVGEQLPTPEICDNLDNNCDVEIDEGLNCNPPVLEEIGDKVVNENELLEFIVSASDADGDILTYSAVGLPAGAALDTNTGQFNWVPTRAQVGNHEIAFEVSDGDLTASETINIEVRGVSEIRESRITNAASLSFSPSLVWTGMEYGVSWHDFRDGSWGDNNCEIYFTRIDASGNKIGNDVRITNDAAYSYPPSLVWAGSKYGVSWYDARGANDEIYFARIDASGNKIGSDVRITTNTTGYFRSSFLAWTGTEYGVSWMDDRDGNYEIYFARIAASGNKIGSDMRITTVDEGSFSPSLAWTGREYGVSWTDERDGNAEIYFARIDASGNKIGQDVRITNAGASSAISSLVWTGAEYGVSWVDSRDGNTEIYFARIDASGNKIGSDVRITNAADDSEEPSLVWAGSDYGVSWHDNRDGNWEIYFARIIGVFGGE